MEKLNDNQIEIYDEDGNKYLMEILFTYENEERNTTYAFIYDKSNPDELILMKYKEDGSIEEVTDEEELSEAEEVLNAFNDDPKINELKN